MIAVAKLAALMLIWYVAIRRLPRADVSPAGIGRVLAPVSASTQGIKPHRRPRCRRPVTPATRIDGAYHFLFLFLTLGLAFMLAIMESVYVMTRREIWKRMTQFWGVLFGINFATGDRHGRHHGIPVRHQLGVLLCTTWATSSARRWRSKA